MVEGQKEKDTIKVVYCRGFKKLLNIESCTADRCKHHLGRTTEPYVQDEKTVAVNDRVLCGYPRWETITQVCEVE